VLTTLDGVAEMQRTMRAGASGFILKGMPESEMLKVIRAVHSGWRHVPAEVAVRHAEHLREGDRRRNGDAAWPASLVSLLLRFALLLLLLAPAPAAAVDPERHISQYGHTAWRVFDGTIPRPVGVTQTTDGYIWFGTRDGLMRFDGVRFSLWRSGDGEPLIKRFSALLGASDGSLWIGTLSGLMHLKNGKLSTYARPSERGAIANIVEDRAGTIWVSRYHMPKGSGPLCRAGEAELVCYGAEEGVPAGYVLGLTQDSDGYFWFGGDVLCRWRPGSAATCFDDVGRQGRMRMDTQDLTSGPSGSVWTAIDAVGPQFGVRYFSGGKWSPFIVPGFDGPSIRSHGIYLDRHNSLWVGTENDGLYRIHDGVADHYTRSDGLSGNAVSWFYEDREGNLWVTTDSGLDMFRDTPVVSYSMAQGLFGSFISSILARRDGSIWIGNQGAIDILRNGNHSLLSPPAMSGDSNVTLFEDHEQTVWLGLGHTVLAYRNGRFFEIRRPDGSPLRQNYAFPVTEDVDGNIWALGQTGHLFRVKGQKVVEDIQLGESLSSALLLEPDKNGGVWIATKAGEIARYHAGQLETYSLKHDGKDPISIHEMIVDSDNSLLISAERGLVRWINGQQTALGVRNGLPCESIYSAIKDDNGALWLYARCGLLQIEASQVAKWEASPSSPISARVFDAHDGAFPSIQAQRQHISSKAPDGRLWFTNGILAQVVDPKHLSKNEVMPPVAIEDVIADRKVLGTQAGMRVPALTRDLQIDYTALSFSVPQKVRFRYILEGHDTAWQEPGERRQAYYTDLTPGKYRFRVIASNNDGVWNEAGATLDFSIAPAWYQTIWFRVFCVTVLVVLLWALYRLRLRQMAHQFNMRLEERVSERTRIARDLHDTLLQSFQGLLLRFQTVSHLLPAGEAKQRLDGAIDQAAQAITEGRDAVQGLRSSTVETNDLAVAIRTIGEELAADETNRNSAVFQVEVEGTPRNLHPILRDEVYRLAGEALRNAFWHAQARRIDVEIRYDQKQFRLRVRDDGKGIDPNVLGGEGREGHYGLHGMRERAKLVGGEVAVWSERGSGTKVELSIPASTAYATGTRRRSRL
jgi:signal transduction histidine kinase/ligand-binding sensor domain-containing protein